MSSTHIGVIPACAVAGHGPLRFIGVFNLAGLVQRANVNQLFDPGLTFDRASGDFSLGRGEVTINEFAIRNGGGRLTLGGLYSMDSENIDAELLLRCRWSITFHG